VKYINIYSAKIILYSIYSAISKRPRDIQLFSSRSVSRVLMQRFTKLSETLALHQQALTVWVGQLYGKELDWAVRTDWRCEWDSCTVRC